jgi:hypothetical protein
LICRPALASPWFDFNIRKLLCGRPGDRANRDAEIAECGFRIADLRSGKIIDDETAFLIRDAKSAFSNNHK